MSAASDKTPQEPWKIFSSAGYAIVMLLVGVPMWWKTTEVYRVSLPYSQIDGLSNLDLRIQIQIQLITTDAHKDHQLGPEIQQYLKESSVYTFSLTTRAPTANEIKAMKESEDLATLDDTLSPMYSHVMPGTVLLFEVNENKEALLKSDPLILGLHRTVFFDRNSISAEKLMDIVRHHVLGESRVAKLFTSIEMPRRAIKDRTTLRKVTASNKYDIQFSLLVPEPEWVMVDWDIESAVKEYVEPFVNALDDFANITVKSQVLYLTSLNLHPQKKQGRHVVTAKDLGLAINPVEGQLASHVSSSPTLNFLVYIPKVDQSPLYIGINDEVMLDSNAFLIPRWGGVCIYNVQGTNEFPVKASVDMSRVMNIFLNQLRLLLGLSNDSPAASLPLTDEIAVRTWESELLFRLRTIENLVHSRVTLLSLSHLLSQISNIVIKDEIGERVQTAVDNLELAAKDLESGLLLRALERSRESFEASEKAFFDPSLLELLYFPEDQKYAIYIPLFLPIGIPVIMSLKTIFQFVKTYGKQKVD